MAARPLGPVVPDSDDHCLDLSRRRLLKLGGVGLLMWGTGFAVTGCACASNAPLAPAGTYWRDGTCLVLSLDAIDELSAVGGAVRVPVGGDPDLDGQIIVAHAEAERYCAFPNRCTHRGRELVYLHEDDALECCSGKSRFDLDGNVLEGPAPEPLTALTAYRDGRNLIIELGP